MNILDEEVLAVATAIILVASVLVAASTIERVEPFSAIGLLNQYCKIGEYPSFALLGEKLPLCIYVYNYMGEPEAYTVVYRFADPAQLPTNTTPSPAPQVSNYTIVLPHGYNATIHMDAKIPENPLLVGKKAALVFELWVYDTKNHRWVYTGKWVHLYVRIEEAPLP